MEAYISYGEERACFYATTGYVADVPPMIELECEKRPGSDRGVESHHCGQRWRDENDRLLWAGNISAKLLGAGHMDRVHSFYESVEQGKPFSVGLEQIKDTVWPMLKAMRRQGNV